jgi:hypothetical protein
MGSRELYSTYLARMDRVNDAARDIAWSLSPQVKSLKKILKAENIEIVLCETHQWWRKPSDPCRICEGLLEDSDSSESDED